MSLVMGFSLAGTVCTKVSEAGKRKGYNQRKSSSISVRQPKTKKNQGQMKEGHGGGHSRVHKKTLRPSRNQK